MSRIAGGIAVALIALAIGFVFRTVYTRTGLATARGVGRTRHEVRWAPQWLRRTGRCQAA